MGGLKEIHIIFTRQTCQIASHLHVFHSNDVKDLGLQHYLISDSFGINYRPLLWPQPVKVVEKGIP